MPDEHGNHAHHLPTMFKWPLKINCVGYVPDEWSHRPLKVFSEIACSFISMYVVGALFVCFPAMLQLKTFCKALGCVYSCTCKPCFCLRTKETMFLFKAVLCSDSPLAAKSDSKQKLEERTVAGKRGSHCCMPGYEEASWPLRSYSESEHTEYLCKQIDKQCLPS